MTLEIFKSARSFAGCLGWICIANIPESVAAGEVARRITSAAKRKDLAAVAKAARAAASFVRTIPADRPPTCSKAQHQAWVRRFTEQAEDLAGAAEACRRLDIAEAGRLLTDHERGRNWYEPPFPIGPS